MELVELISQLDEVKFARLLRHLQDARPRDMSGQITVPSFPINLPNSQLFVSLVGRLTSTDSYLGSWAFQVAGLPIGIQTSPLILEILLRELRRAMLQLALLPDPLGTLLGASCEHDYLEVLGLAQGCDYHLVTNVPLGAPAEMVQAFHDGGRELVRDILVEPEWHPRFGLGSPETIAAHARAEAERFILDLLRSPSGYQFVAREGRIAISAYSEHGLYLAHGAGRLPATTSAMAAATVTLPTIGRGKALVDQLEQLINDPAVKEPDIQRLFEEQPELLRLINPNYAEILPHVCLSDSGGNKLIPDFMARIDGSNVWDIVELKLPKHSIRTTKGGRLRPSAQAARGIAQLLEYRDFFTKQSNRETVVRRYGCAPLEPNLVLVTGMGKPGVAEWRTDLIGYPGATLVSYQFVLEQARRSSVLHEGSLGESQFSLL